jgi:predicted DNA-binding protein (MmcQ/YjbR family)
MVQAIPTVMKLDRLQSLALSWPQSSVVEQWGGLVYKVAGKVFLVLSLDGRVLEGITFKCAPEEFDELTQIDGLAQAPYFAKRHWVKLEDPAALPEAQLTARIRRSYDLVVAGLPKKTRQTLGLVS